MLSDDEVRALAELGVRIERHYGAPQDTEWAFDRRRQRLDAAVAAGDDAARRGDTLEPAAERVRRADRCTASARARRRSRHASGCSDLAEAAKLSDGEVLVAQMTAPDWVPLMRRAAAIVTDSGGMTCHAAIVSRELGIPCVVGADDATRSCATASS